MAHDRGNVVKPPFFIIGGPRSGTTLLRLMLASHREIVVPPECGFAAWLYPRYGHWGKAEYSDPEAVAAFCASVTASRKFDTWGLEAGELAQFVLELAPNDYAEACSGIYRFYASSIGKPMAAWGDKNNFYLKHIDLLQSLFAGARFIHIVRDGRDVACSYREVMSIASDSPYRPALPTDMASIAELWAADVQMIAAHMPVDRSLVVRYEDLAQQPSRQLEKICAWLGFPFDSEMLAFHQRTLEPDATMDWKTRTREPASDRTVGRYRSILSAEETAQFEEIAGDALRLHGYLS